MANLLEWLILIVFAISALVAIFSYNPAATKVCLYMLLFYYWLRQLKRLK